MTPATRTLTNLGLSQGVWLACVLGGDAGILGVLLHLAIYHHWIGRLPQDLAVLLPVAGVGFVLDSLIAAAGWLDYRADGLSGELPAPLWLAALWLSFSTLFLHGLQWLQDRLWFAAGLGAVAGPATYYSGTVLGAATPGLPGSAVWLLYGVLWAILLPLFACHARRRLRHAGPMAH